MSSAYQTVSRVANETYGHSRRIMPQQPWWENLETSFHKFPDDFELDLPTQLLVDGTAAIDIGVRTAVASLVSVLALPLSANPRRLWQDLEDGALYRELASTHQADQFFQFPDVKVDVQERKPGWVHFRPPDGQCRELAFSSPFQPVNPRLRKRYLNNQRNQQAVAQYWTHDNGPRPTICVVHGFMADPYWVNSLFLGLPWFYRMGYDILLYTLPFHGARQGRWSPFSGHGYFANGISHISETVAHSIYDFRLFLNYLESQGVPRFGVTGISLGGYTSALLAAVEERLDFSIPNVPVVTLFDLMLQWFPASAVIKTALRLSGVSIKDARHIMAVHCPLTYPSLLAKERLMIIGGAGDRFAPPKHARLLWDHWDRPGIHWFPGNHILHLDQGKYLKDVAAFLRDIGFADE
jgi:hypothetical protein